MVTKSRTSGQFKISVPAFKQQYLRAQALFSTVISSYGQLYVFTFI